MIVSALVLWFSARGIRWLPSLLRLNRLGGPYPMLPGSA